MSGSVHRVPKTISPASCSSAVKTPVQSLLALHGADGATSYHMSQVSTITCGEVTLFQLHTKASHL